MGKCLAVIMVIGLFSSVVTGETVIVDDHFDDGSVGTNTAGIGSGFNFDGPSESGSIVKFTNGYGWDQHRITSKDGAAIGGSVTRFEFRGVSFAKNPTNPHTGSTDRLYLGVKGSDVANSMQGNPDAGFWIQIESDSVATGGGNGSWTGTSTLFYESSADVSTKLVSWTFDTLNWDDNNAATMNFTPVLDIILDLGPAGYSLVIEGDTINILTGSMSGSYAAAGITNELTTGYAAVFTQSEAPGIDTFVDQIIVTEDASALGNVSEVAPANYDSGVPVDQLLEWMINEPTVAMIDLYLAAADPNFQAVHKKLSQVSATTTTYQPNPVLAFSTDYYWRVDTYEPNLAPGATDYFLTTGPTWTFTTRAQQPAVSAVDPAIITADDDGTDSVTLSVTGENVDTYQWYMIGSPTDIQLTEGSKYTGVNTAILTINNIVSADEGYYYCSVANSDYPLPVTNKETGPGLLAMRRLVIHYPLDTVDEFGVTPDVVSGYDMVLANNTVGLPLPSLVAGVPELGGSGLLFNNIDGTDPNLSGQYATAGDVDVETMGDGLTVEVWANWAGTNSDWQGLVTRRSSWGADTMMWQLEQGQSGTGTSFTRSGSSSTAQAPLTLNQWTHIAATYDTHSGTLRIYRNGELYNTAGSAFTYGNDPNAPLKLGCNDLVNGVADAFYYGVLDDVKFYNYARTVEQVAHDYLDVVQTGYVCNRELYDLVYDFNNNCIIDLGDFAMFADTWLDSYRIYPQQP